MPRNGTDYEYFQHQHQMNKNVRGISQRLEELNSNTSVTALNTIATAYKHHDENTAYAQFNEKNKKNSCSLGTFCNSI